MMYWRCQIIFPLAFNKNSQHSAWTPPPVLSPPQPLRCFTVINSYNIPERTRGVMSCTSQMKRAEAERLNGLTKSDKETSVAAGTGSREGPGQGFFSVSLGRCYYDHAAVPDGLSPPTVDQSLEALLCQQSTRGPQTHTPTTQGLLLNLNRAGAKQAPLLTGRKPTHTEQSSKTRSEF